MAMKVVFEKDTLRLLGAQIIGYDGFVNIPVDRLRERLEELDIHKKVYVMCHTGLRSYLASQILSQKGYDCFHLSGGYWFYKTVTSEKYFQPFSYPCGAEK